MRQFIDAPTDTRCTATITLKDKSTAQCGRGAKLGGLCKQHAKMAEYTNGGTMDDETRSDESDPVCGYCGTLLDENGNCPAMPTDDTTYSEASLLSPREKREMEEDGWEVPSD